MTEKLSRIPGSGQWLWLSAAVIVLDQVTKQLVASNMSLFDRIDVYSFFALHLVHNSGAAFSFLADASGWQRWFFIVLGVSVSVVIMIWLRRLPRGQVALALGLSLVLGGALGNVIDRAVYGYVIDFLLFHYNEASFPRFNVADTAISIGAFFLIIDALFQPKEKVKAKPKESDEPKGS